MTAHINLSNGLGGIVAFRTFPLYMLSVMRAYAGEVLYGIFGDRNELLYLGKAKDFNRRFQGHDKLGPAIAHGAVRIGIHYLADPSRSQEIEAAMIRHHRPILNIQHNPDYPNGLLRHGMMSAPRSGNGLLGPGLMDAAWSSKGFLD